MKDTLIVVGVALIAIAIGVFFFLRGNLARAPLSAISENQTSVTAVPFTEIAHGQKSTVATRVNYFITSMDELNKLWKMINATSTPPSIDFKTHAVIAVFAGEQPTTGYAIAVAKIEDSTTRNVSLMLAKPDSKCIEGQIVTTPYEIVAVPVTTLPLAHQDVFATTTCTN